jgi:hypothetical protein
MAIPIPKRRASDRTRENIRRTPGTLLQDCAWVPQIAPSMHALIDGIDKQILTGEPYKALNEDSLRKKRVVST